MCIGIPMQVLSCDGLTAECDDGRTSRQVDLALVGEQPPGTWLLVFLGAAREVLDETAVEQIRNALDAVATVMQGGTAIDHLFADLIDREPRLPPHLQAQVKTTGGDTTA
ncbi:MAG: HypC/HybG/HupF family hydrogenase formation chaperone [Gammaproteobacteria bacterium]|nr:HypC/HybG/HupF family hydrogenase formation chaperone [Gammaproteobacteria bacterium]